MKLKVRKQKQNLASRFTAFLLFALAPIICCIYTFSLPYVPRFFYLFHANAEHFFLNCINYLILHITYGPNMNLTEGFGSVT